MEGANAVEIDVFFGRIHGVRGAILTDRVGALLDFVGLRDRKDDLVFGYSGGMQRRLNLACSLVYPPTWLQQLAHASLAAWAMDGIHDLILRDRSLADVLPILGALVAYGGICLAAG